MYRLNLLAMLLFLLLLPVTAAAFTVAGTYDSSEGVITLQQSGDRITGRYPNDNGELTGLMFGPIFEGFWIEDHSDRRCSTPKNGRYYWGRVSFTFTGNGFSGNWGYCGEATSRPWNGTLRGSSPAPPPPQSSAADPFAITEEMSIAGVWGSSEGVITFRQQGNRVAGRYPNDNGEIVGSINNSLLSGYWIEDHSAQRCSSPKNGRHNWGRVELRFSGNRFTGMYGHCDGPLKSPWGGERR